MGAPSKRLVVRISLLLIIIVVVAAVVRQITKPRLVFRPHDVFWYVTEDYKPLSIFGDREVEGVFEYSGPVVSRPSTGVIRRTLGRIGIRLYWQPPPHQFGQIVLSDESGRELARMPGSGQIDLGAARAEMRLQESGTRLYVSWFFPLPPEVDRSKPVRFSTTFSINGLPALPVQVTIPPTGRPPATRRSF